MEKFRVVSHLNGYPCSWMKMGSSNVSLMRGSRVPRSVSRERCPVISPSNHLMRPVNLNKMDMHCAISGFRRWSEWLGLVKQGEKTKQQRGEVTRKKQPRGKKPRRSRFAKVQRQWQEFQLSNYGKMKRHKCCDFCCLSWINLICASHWKATKMEEAKRGSVSSNRTIKTTN